ncbi:spore germination protein [Bacillus toyonensis]|uniref:spore germination protein n=1 Tax=Bacillus toyonensis TaxID=155322 RepID=UPI000BFD6D1A|nr:spore germination protein [Bacillus toyonensis]PHG57633.1 spore germination protein [Bacillus toyonensis]
MFNIEKDDLEKRAIPLHQGLYPTRSENISYIQKQLYHTNDLCVNEMCIHDTHIVLFYLDTTSDYKNIRSVILDPLSNVTQLDTVLETIAIQKTNNINTAVDMLLRGNSIIYVEGKQNLYIGNTAKSIQRAPDEPQNEKVIRGAHEGFVEDIKTNLSLIRKKIVNRQLKIKYFTLGKESQTQIALIYMDRLVESSTVEKMEEKLVAIPSNMISGPGHIEAFIESQPFSPFPHILYTERPDRVMAHITEGRVALVVDGSADVLIVPITFFAFFHTPDDFNSRIFAASFLRVLRIISFFIAIMLPAIYIAVISYHFEIIPNEIIVLVKSSVEGIPFSPLIEASIMALTIELIREAGVRLPTPIGQTIGIIGGLIIGDAVVRAGFVSNTMVIVIAVTAIASFTIPSYEMSTAVRLLMFPLMLAATCLGFAGIAFGMMFILAHLCKLESFGVPYFIPLAPLKIAGLKDSFIRFPIWMVDRSSKDTSVLKKAHKNETEE